MTLVAFVSFLQTTNSIIIWQIKPNLVFALFAVLAYVNKNWVVRSVIILISAVLLKFSPIVSWADIIFVSVSLLIFALVDYLPWRRLVNSIVSLTAGTLVFGLSHLNLSILWRELAINTAAVVIFFVIIRLLYGEEKISKKNRF